MNKPRKALESAYSLYKRLMALFIVAVIAVPVLFTATEMGVFAGEPRVEIQNTVIDPQAPTLRVATDYGFSPDSYINKYGELSGLYIEIMNEVANRMGANVEYKTGDWLTCRQMLTDGDADILLGLEIFSNMEGTLRTSPISSDEMRVYGKDRIDSAAALAGKRVALMVRSVIEVTYDLQCEYVEYYNTLEILQAVENGEVDYAISQGAVSDKIIEANGLDLQPSLVISQSYPALAVQDTRPDLKAQLNTALQSMSKDGTIARLQEKWITNFTKNKSLAYVLETNQLFYLTFLFGATIVLCIFVFVYKYEKKQREYIDALLKYQTQLKESNEEAQRANSAKSVFLSHMSHDIRTPLNGIMGMAKRIRRDLNDPAAVEKDLDKIDAASGYLLALLNDVLDVSAVESGKTKLEIFPFDLRQEMDGVRTLVEEQAKERGITVSLQTDGLQHTRLVGSVLHLRRILTNLTNNAVKYNKVNGSVEVLAQERNFDGQKAEFVFTIRDTGIGMSEEFIRENLFKPFEQEKDDARTVYRGTGVGMTIVDEFIKAMGGTIAVESEQGTGTTFTVCLPFTVDTTAEPEKQTEEPEADIRGMHVMVVEDNELNREIAQCMLEDEGVQVTVAVNGQEAVNLLAASDPDTYDAVLMDIMMPVMDGLQATREIRALPREDAKTVAIIAMTANAFAEDKAKALQAGMDEHLGKPLDFAKLKEALSRYRKTVSVG